jgi:hypothetical protein
MTNHEKIIAEKEEVIDRMAKEAMADVATIFRLRELLRRATKGQQFCLVCGEFLFSEVGHLPDCDLAKELGEQPADTKTEKEGNG